MADSKNLALQILITAKDTATSVFGRLFSYLDDNTKVVAGKIREAFTGLFGGGLDGSIEFEAALARVQAKAGASEEEMRRLKIAAQDYAREIGLGADGSAKAAQALEYLTGAGLDVNQAISALPSTLRVAKNEQISTEKAATSLTDTLSVMGLAYEETTRAGDVLQKSADMTSTSVTALAEAIRESGGEAVKVGLTFEQTVAILTAFAKAGIQGSQAGTALKAVLQDITDPASKARQEMAKFGTSTGDVSQFIGKLIELGPRALSVTRAFSQESGPGLAALLRVGTDGLKEYGQALEKDAVGALEKASATINNTTRGALDRLATSWAQIKTTLAEPLLKPIADGAELLSQKLGALMASGALQRIADGIKNLYTEATASIARFVASIDWDHFQQQASDALANVRQTLNETLDSVKGKIQTVSDWTSAVFSPLTQAVDGYRLAWALANKDQAEATRIQAQIEARTAAIGRALSGTSAEYVKAGSAAKDLAASSEDAAKSGDALQAAQKAAADRVAALSDAVQQQAAEVDRLSEANAKGEASSDDYGTAVLRLWDTQSKLKAAQAEATAAQAEATAVQKQLADATKDTAGAVELQSVSYQGTIPRIEAVSKAALAYQDRLAEVSRELSAAAANAGNWSEGLDLTSVQLYGLKEAAAASAEKLALVQQAQRDGVASANDVQAATKAAAEAQDRYTQALAAYVAQQERSVAAAERATGLEQQAYDVRIRQAEAEVALAKAKNDTNAQSRAEAELADLLQQKADAAVAEKQREIEAYQNLIAATQQKLEADGQLDSAERDTLAVMADKLKAMELEQRGLQVTAEALRDQAAAAREAAKAQEEAAQAIADAKTHAEQLQAAGDLVSATLSGWAQRLQALSPAARAAFDGVQSGADNATDSVKGITAAMQENLTEQGRIQSSGGQGFIAWANEVAGKALDIEAAFLGQKQRLLELIETLNKYADTGEMTGLVQQSMIQSSSDLDKQFSLLNDQDLSTLRSALADANDKLQKMQDEAQSAKDKLSELNAEYAAEKGDQATSDRLKTQLEQRQALAEAEKNLAAAQQANNRELIALYQQQIDKINQLYDLKLKNLAADAKTSATTTTASSTSASATATAAGSGSAAASKTYTLNLKIGGASWSGSSTTDPSAFLSALEREQRTAA